MKGPTTGALVGALVGVRVGSAEGGLVSPTLVGLGVGLNVGSAVGAAAPSLIVTAVTRLTALFDPDPPGETRALIVTVPAPAAGIVIDPTPTKMNINIKCNIIHTRTYMNKFIPFSFLFPPHELPESKVPLDNSIEY